jgi:hypothetical protein
VRFVVPIEAPRELFPSTPLAFTWSIPLHGIDLSQNGVMALTWEKMEGKKDDKKATEIKNEADV